MEVEDVEKEFQKELKDAQDWFAQVVANEEEWTAPGSSVNPDEEFSELYHQEPILLTEKILNERKTAAKNEAQTARRTYWAMLGLIAGSLIIFVCTIPLLRKIAVQT